MMSGAQPLRMFIPKPCADLECPHAFDDARLVTLAQAGERRALEGTVRAWAYPGRVQLRDLLTYAC
jgi:hypothetical protein